MNFPKSILIQHWLGLAVPWNGSDFQCESRNIIITWKLTCWTNKRPWMKTTLKHGWPSVWSLNSQHGSCIMPWITAHIGLQWTSSLHASFNISSALKKTFFMPFFKPFSGTFSENYPIIWFGKRKTTSLKEICNIVQNLPTSKYATMLPWRYKCSPEGTRFDLG